MPKVQLLLLFPISPAFAFSSRSYFFYSSFSASSGSPSSVFFPPPTLSPIFILLLYQAFLLILLSVPNNVYEKRGYGYEQSECEVGFGLAPPETRAIAF